MCIVVGWCDDDVLDGFCGFWDFCCYGCKDIERNKQCCCFCSSLWTSSLAVHEYHQSINEEMGHGCLSGVDSQEDVAEVSVPRLSDLVLFDPWDKHSDSEHLPKPAQLFCLTVLSWHPGGVMMPWYPNRKGLVQHGKHVVISAGSQNILPLK